MQLIQRSGCSTGWGRLAAGAAFLALLADAGIAEAQDWQPKKQGHRLSSQLEVWPTEAGTTVTGEFVGQIAVLDELMIDFSLPSAYGSYEVGPFNADHFVFGNPSFGAHWGDKVMDALALWAGGKITAPVIIDPDAEVFTVALNAARNRAFFDLDRFFPETLTVRPQFGLEAHFAEYFYFRTDFGVPLYFPAGDTFDETQVTIEHGNEFEGRSEVGIGGGARLQLFYLATDEGLANDDRFQAAIEPYFVFEPHGEDGFFARVGAFIALDEPLGFGFDRDNLATIRITLGGKW